MKFRVDLAETAELDPCVDLGRRDRGMSEHFLDDAKVRASRQQMSREAVPERMWANRHIQAGCRGMNLHESPEPDPTHRPSGF